MPVVFASRGASRACAAVVAGAVSVALVMGGSAANAEEPGLVGAAAEVVLAEVAPEVMSNIADVEVGDGEVSFTENDVTAEVPLDASEPLRLSSEGGGVSVQLPFGDEAELVESEDPGVVVFDNGNDSTSAVVVHDDSSVQVNTIIESSEAPTRYDYAVTVPDGGRLASDETGAVAVLDADGGFVAGVAAPWAKDANGVEVPTRYEVSGSTLTQVVEHSSAYAYPITADPWWGKRLFQKVWRGTWKGDYTYNAWVTPWGALVLSGGGGIGGHIAGGFIMRGAGWDEWRSAYPAVTNKATLRQQYDCHVAAGVYGLPFTKDYNLERARSNRDNWFPNVWNHHCNW